MRLKQASLAVMLAGMWALGCSSSNSPTSSSGFQLIITASLANTANAATITEAQLLVDGATAVVFSQSTPAASANLTVTGSAGSGAHTLQFVISAQTSSPNSYTTAMPAVQVFNQNGSLLKTILLPTETAVLATGGTINYSFSL